jgi:hypothetical protein
MRPQSPPDAISRCVLAIQERAYTARIRRSMVAPEADAIDKWQLLAHFSRSSANRFTSALGVKQKLAQATMST